MTIDALPTPPQTSDPTNFNARADAFLAAMVTFGAQVNATLAALGTPGLGGGTMLASLGFVAGLVGTPGLFVSGDQNTGLAQLGGGDTLSGVAGGVENWRMSTTAFTLKQLLDLGTAGQIKFPATQNPSSDANTLDDYEEGTWTPTDGSGAGLTLIVVAATYTKNGRRVHADANIAYPATADGTAAKIGSLPFTSASANVSGGYVSWTTNSANFRHILITPSATTAPIYKTDGAAATNANLNAVSAYISVNYNT